MAPKRLPIKSQARKPSRKRSTGGGGGGPPGPEGAKAKGKGTEHVHEAFVRAFGIPTNMYRYLARRHRQRPLFLQRSLSYMRERSEPTSEEKEQAGLKTYAKRSLEQAVTRLVERAGAAPSHVNGLQSPSHFWCVQKLLGD